MTVRSTPSRRRNTLTLRTPFSDPWFLAFDSSETYTEHGVSRSHQDQVTNDNGTRAPRHGHSLYRRPRTSRNAERSRLYSHRGFHRRSLPNAPDSNRHTEQS